MREVITGPHPMAPNRFHQKLQNPKALCDLTTAHLRKHKVVVNYLATGLALT